MVRELLERRVKIIIIKRFIFPFVGEIGYPRDKMNLQTIMLISEGRELSLVRKHAMNITDAKKDCFKMATEEEWEEAVLKSLKGRKLDTLHTPTFENIILKPLYSDSSSSKKAEESGKSPYKRGIYKHGYQHNPLKICQVAEGEHLKETILGALRNGQNTISFDVHSLDHTELTNLLTDLPLHDYPIFLQAGDQQESLMNILAESAVDLHPQGAVIRDLITEWAEKGVIPIKETTALSEWMECIKYWNQASPTIKTIFVNSKPYHEAGADAVKEIAYALSLGAHYIYTGIQTGISPMETAEKMIFSFSIDSVFFMQIAKLRAARKLWYAVGKAYGQDCSFKMDIHAETSKRNKTSFDRYVNLLRSTNEGMAAVIGNCQYLTVAPFDELLREKSSLGKRLARNIPLILKEESMLMQTADPGGGSYYLETLTDELCHKAWDLFLEIEKKGGILTELKNGNLQRSLAEQAKSRLSAVASRKEKIVGINVYANPKEERPNISQKFKEVPTIQEGEKEIFPLEPVRLASAFEVIRSMNLTWGNKREQQQKIHLMGIGSLSQSKAYLDFAKELLAAGGLNYTETIEIKNIEKLEKTLAESKAEYILICGDENQLDSPLSSIKLTTHTPIYAVGKFESTIKALNWRSINRHTNMIDLLTVLSSSQEVRA